MSSRSFQAGTAAMLCFTVLALLPVADAAEPTWRNGVALESFEFRFRFDRNALASAGGATNAYRRLVRSAQQACRIPGSHSAQVRRFDKRCVAELVDQAVRRIGSVKLAELHGVDQETNLARRP